MPTVALGCDNLATLDENSQYVLNQNVSAPCVGAVVPLVVEAVTCDGRGFSYDRTLANQDYRANDIDMVMPAHDGVLCAGTGS